MAIENNIGAQQPRVFQPLPRQDTRRPIADFSSKARPAAQDSLALPVQEPAPARATAVATPALPPAPAFPRRVARETPTPASVRAAADAPQPRTPEAPAMTDRAVPVRLNNLVQEARGREALARMARGAAQPGPATPVPMARIAPFKASVERAPVAQARNMEPAAAPAPARNRFAALATVNQEISQLNARQTVQSAVRTRTAQENAGSGGKVARALIDQKV